MTLTNDNISLLRTDLEVALQAVSEKWDMDIKLGAIRYDTVSFRSALTGLKFGAKTDEQSYYDLKYKMGIVEHPRNTILRDKATGQLLLIIGWKKSRPKYPIQFKTLDGNGIKGTLGYLKNLEKIK